MLAPAQNDAFLKLVPRVCEKMAIPPPQQLIVITAVRGPHGPCLAVDLVDMGRAQVHEIPSHRAHAHGLYDLEQAFEALAPYGRTGDELVFCCQRLGQELRWVLFDPATQQERLVGGQVMASEKW
jgi:hypothetical protein